MKLRPLNDKIIIKASKADEKTKSGLYIPEVAQDKRAEGEGIAVGPGKVNENTGARSAIDLKAGDRVLYSNYAGTEFKVEGEDVLLMDEGDILAVIEK